MGFSIGQIPVSKIEEFGEKRGYDRITIDLLKEIIGALDIAYLEWLSEEQEKKKKKGA